MKKIFILLVVFSLGIFAKTTLAQDLAFPKNQFQKTLSKIQKCTGEELGVGHVETNLGEALIFWRDDMVSAQWIDSIGDSTYVTHMRSLFQDRFEAKEIKEFYYAEEMTSDFPEPRKKILISDAYDQDFLNLLKVRDCPVLWSAVIPLNASPETKFNLCLSRVRNCFDKKSGAILIENYGGEGNTAQLEWNKELVRLTLFVKGENLGITTVIVVYPEGGMESKYGYTSMGNGELYLEYDIFDSNSIDDGSNPDAWKEEMERAYKGLVLFLEEQNCK